MDPVHYLRSTTVTSIPELPEDLTGQIFGTISDHVASGGFGSVYRCEWKRPTGPVKVWPNPRATC